MSATLRSDGDGLTSALQVNGLDRLILRSTGALEATANPATGERSMALATMQKFADEFPALVTAAGWQMLPSGILIQWGLSPEFNVGNGNSSTVSVTFPIAFPTAVFGVALGGKIGNTEGTVSLSRSLPPTLTGCTVQLKNLAGGSNNAMSAHWIAIGN